MISLESTEQQAVLVISLESTEQQAVLMISLECTEQQAVLVISLESTEPQAVLMLHFGCSGLPVNCLFHDTINCIRSKVILICVNM